MLTRRSFLSSTLATTLAAAAPPHPKKPNFLIVLADDMGFSDAGCYGGDIATPTLDSLAANGLRFSQFYSTARCGPSRNCITTGYYAQQNACDVMTPGRIPSYTKFAPEHLQPLGYRSYHSGKWHLRFKPVAGAGFHHSYTLLDQDRFFWPRRHLLNDSPLPPPEPADNYYGTIAIADHAVKFLDRHQQQHKDDPFYLYLAFTAPHFPLHALQADIDRYQDHFADGWDAARERRFSRLQRAGLVNCSLAPLEPAMRPAWNTNYAEQAAKFGPGEVYEAAPWASLTGEQKKFQRLKMAIHAAMITRMDTELARVINQLKQMDAYRDTLIIFVSDNGASSEQLIRNDGHDPAAAPGSGYSHLCLGPGWASAANAPFRLHKSWVHEGGISSPCIVHWPNGIKDPGKIRHTPGHLIDIVPTMLDLAGGKPIAEGAPPMPGRSLAPAFARDRSIGHDFLYFNHSNNRALRQGDYKLVATGKQGPWELYDMRRDRAEQHNLIQDQPARAAKMAAQWESFDAAIVKTRESSPAVSTKPLI